MLRYENINNENINNEKYKQDRHCKVVQNIIYFIFDTRKTV